MTEKTEKTGTTKRRTGRPKPIEFTYLKPEEQKEYYEVSFNGAPTEQEALLGPLTGYYDTGGYVFSRYPTRLQHPDWREFRDPDKYWFRSYNAYLAEQSAIITHGTETLLQTGYLECVDPGWHEILRYLAALRFHEAGALKLWQMIQYMAQAETISYCAVEECGSRLLSCHTLNRYALDLAGAIPGWNDDNAMEVWVDDPVYVGPREFIEHELTIRDWAEGIIVDAILAPALYYEPMLRFFAINGAMHGDASTPTIIGCFTALAERRLKWAKEFARVCLSVDANHEPVQEWLGVWEPRAEAALESLAPLYERVPRAALKYGAEADRARAQYHGVLEEVGMTGMTGVKR